MVVNQLSGLVPVIVAGRDIGVLSLVLTNNIAFRMLLQHETYFKYE